MLRLALGSQGNYYDTTPSKFSSSTHSQEYSMLSTAVFHTKYWSHSASTLDTPKGIGIEWIELFLLPYEIFCKKNLPYRFFFD